MKKSILLRTFLSAILFTTVISAKALEDEYHNLGCQGNIVLYASERCTLDTPFPEFFKDYCDWYVRKVYTYTYEDYQITGNGTYGGLSAFVRNTFRTVDVSSYESTENLPYKYQIYCKRLIVYMSGRRESYECYWNITWKERERITITASTEGGSILAGSKVYLKASKSDAKIYYTTNGSNPWEKSPVYTSSGIIIDKDMTLKAIAYSDGDPKYLTSEVTSWTFTVNIPIKEITLNTSLVTLEKDKTYQLTATITPTNATDKSVTWSSSSSTVATVSNNGIVSAKSPGTATITCKANDGSGVLATCTVTVTSPVILVENITLNNSSVTLEESKTHQLTATVTPSNATDKSVTWSSSNTNVATVSSSGLVTAKSAGTATITCKANDGSGKSASCKVTVESTPTNPDIYITSIQSGNADLTSLTPNDKLSLTATFMNYGATATVSTRLWIFDQDMQTVVYSNSQTSTFYGNSLTTVSMDYALTDIPAGKYFASILYYDEWERNTWLYASKYLVEIDIVDSSPISKGDVNEDGKVNGTDLVALTNIILGKNAQKASADVNGDGKVNGTDYVALANIILGKSAASRSIDTDMAVSGTATLQVEPLTIRAGETRELTVNLTNPNDELTLLQFDLLLPEGLYINKVGDEPSVSMGSRTSGNSHQLSAYADGQRVRCLLASPANELISGTEGTVVRLTVTAAEDFCGGSLLLSNAIGVSPCEQEVIMPSQRYGLTESATGVAGVKNAEESSEVYSLTGQRQVKMKRGINLVNGKKIIKK